MQTKTKAEIPGCRAQLALGAIANNPWIFLAVALCCSAVATAQTTEIFGDVSVVIDDVMEGEGTHGYAEYRVGLHNLSATEARRVTLTCPDPRTRYGKSHRRDLESITRTVVLQPASPPVKISFFQPALNLNGRGLAVSVDGTMQEPALPLKTVSSGYRYDRGPVILVSRGCPGEFRVAKYSYYTAPHTATTGAGAPYSFPHNFQFHRSSLAVASWSEQWLGYSRYDAVAITGQELDNAPPQVRSALSSYVECGGILFVLGAWQVPSSWQDEPVAANGFITYSAGFGRCIVSEHAKIDDLAENQLEFLERRLQPIGNLWSRANDIDASSANSIFPVTQDLSIPVRGMFIVLLIFTVLIGPANYWVLARKKKKMWFLWTVPLISCVACILVFGYFLLVTGWKRHVRDMTVTVLDERTHRASTIGWRAFYSTTTPSNGLKFGWETEITPLTRQTTGLTMDFTSGQHLTTGWIAARVPAHFLMRKSETRKERLTVKRDGQGNLRAINLLGSEIRELTVADERGKLFRIAGPIAPGESVKLSSGGSALHVPPSRAEFNEVFFSMDNVGALSAVQGTKPRPLCYVAVLGTGPFVEEALENATSRESSSVVYGIMKGIDDES